MNKILITICARGGSKGLPDKNILKINDKALINYSIDHAIELKKEFDCDYIVSTDSKIILETATLNDLSKNYERPNELSGDSIGKLDTIKHAVLYAEKEINNKFDIIIDFDVTAPFRKISEVKEMINQLLGNDKATNILSAKRAKKNPYFNMVELNKDGFAELCKEGRFLSRQEAPEVFDLNASVYCFKRKFFETEILKVITNSTLIFKLSSDAYDVDSKQDFLMIEFLVSKGYLTI
jgi:CMP-N,N'-diacetyllegionaminic acid synthase